MPLIVRGPGVPKGQTVDGQVSNIDFAPTLLDFAEREGRAGRWTASRCCRRSATRSSAPNRALEIEALAPLFAGHDPGQRAGTGPTRACAPTSYTYVVWTETGEEELYDRAADPYQLNNVAADPAYAAIKADLAAKLAQARALRGQGVQRDAVRRAAPSRSSRAAFAGSRPPAPRRRSSRRSAASTTPATARSSSSRASPPDAQVDRLEHDRAQRLPGRRSGTAFDAGALAAELGDDAGAAQRPAPLPHGLGHARATGGTHVVRRPARCARSRRSRSAAPPTSSRPPYTERTINRDNTWHWKKGRTVFELVAPGGDDLRDAELLADRRPGADDRPSCSSLGDRLAPARAAGATAAAARRSR